jgi:hypothetical protein
MAIDRHLIRRLGVARTPSVAAGLAGEATGRSGPDLAEPGQIRPFSFFSYMKFCDGFVLLHSKLLRKSSRHQNLVIQISL